MKTQIYIILLISFFTGIINTFAQNDTANVPKKFDYSTVQVLNIKYNEELETSYKLTEHENYKSCGTLTGLLLGSKKESGYEESFSGIIGGTLGVILGAFIGGAIGADMKHDDFELTNLRNEKKRDMLLKLIKKYNN